MKKEKVTFEELLRLVESKKEVLDQSQIEKLYKVVDKTGKKYTTTLLRILEDKNLGPEQIGYILSYANTTHIENLIIDSVNNPENLFHKIQKKGNLVEELNKITGLDPEHIKTLINCTTGAAQKSVGRGELAIISLLHDTKSAKVGDIETSQSFVELKFAEAILASSRRISRGIKSAEIQNTIVTALDIPKPEQSRIYEGRREWVNRLLNYTDDITKIQKVLDTFYNKTVTLPPTLEVTVQNLKEEIARQLAKAYMEEIDQKIMIINKEYEYQIYNTVDELEKNIGKTLFVSHFSDLTPRVVYKGFI